MCFLLAEKRRLQCAGCKNAAKGSLSYEKTIRLFPTESRRIVVKEDFLAI
jgi:hypothetical protein